MKTSIETNTPNDTQRVSEISPVGSPRNTGSTRLKLLVAVVAMTAAWLSYQAVSETIILNQVLDRVHAAMSEEMPAKSATSAGSNKTETKPRVAGL